MPEYLASGVFMEETSFRQKAIEGVSTSTAGFVGPTRFGPVNGKPELLTSYSEFERIYGGIDRLQFDDISEPTHNYLALAVRAFFEEGGQRLYVARVFDGKSIAASRAAWQPEGSSPACVFRARHPGKAGEFSLTLIFRLVDDSRGTEPLDSTAPEDGSKLPVLRGIREYDVVSAGTKNTSLTQQDPNWYWVEKVFDEESKRDRFQLIPGTGASPPENILELRDGLEVKKLTVSVRIEPTRAFPDGRTWDDLSIHPQHPRSLSRVFAENPADRSTLLDVPLVFETSLTNGADLVEALMKIESLASSGSRSMSADDAWRTVSPDKTERSHTVTLTNGRDGKLPAPDDYECLAGSVESARIALSSLEELENISIVAAPGSSFDYSRILRGSDENERKKMQQYPRSIARRMISHCERMRYRVAVLDAVNNNSLSEVRAYRGFFDSARAAFYYPWIMTRDPLTEQLIPVPPSGSICGILARNDIERGVHKAPANEIIRTASGLEFVLNKAQQEVLNTLGINCLRFFESRGYRVWGARTASSDPEWKYLSVRRYFAYLERSIDRGTQWAVFENNGPALWSKARRTIEDFLFNEWRQGHLAGATQDQAYFVTCDRSTMSQNDIDNGRMICLIGAATLKTSEFVIFRIAQQTADS